MAKTRTITLTDHPPVTIQEDAWPIIAEAKVEVNRRGTTPLPPYECAAWWLIVRQHADGRTLVYGVADAPSRGWPTHGCVNWKGGVLLIPGEIHARHLGLPARGDEGATEGLVSAIKWVGACLCDEGGAPANVVRECIASLPAEPI